MEQRKIKPYEIAVIISNFAPVIFTCLAGFRRDPMIKEQKYIIHDNRDQIWDLVSSAGTFLLLYMDSTSPRLKITLVNMKLKVHLSTGYCT